MKNFRPTEPPDNEIQDALDYLKDAAGRQERDFDVPFEVAYDGGLNGLLAALRCWKLENTNGGDFLVLSKTFINRGVIWAGVKYRTKKHLIRVDGDHHLNQAIKPAPRDDEFEIDLRKVAAEMTEKEIGFLTVIAENGITRAAEILGMTRGNVWIKKEGIIRKFRENRAKYTTRINEMEGRQ